jgi:hypothetical protein
MKHVGKMKNNNAKIIIVYRTLPGDPYSALVVGTNGLGDTYHDALMNLVQDNSAQQSNELADILAVRKFPDGSNMLEWLHNRGSLKKVPTSGVIVTPDTQTSIPLDELNVIIAEQKGVSIDELAITDGKTPNKKSVDSKKSVEETVVVEDTSPAALRSKADALFKQAQLLRKQADEMDPPKRRTKKVAVVTE